MSVFSSFWLGLFTCVILLHVVSGLQCAACVDGKVAHVSNTYKLGPIEIFRILTCSSVSVFLPRGKPLPPLQYYTVLRQYPPCNHDYGKMRKITTVECKSSCLAAEIVNRGVYTGTELVIIITSFSAITRFCADKVFFDNSTYRDNRMFQTVPAPDPNLVNYEISSRVCKTDLCNLDKSESPY